MAASVQIHGTRANARMKAAMYDADERYIVALLSGPGYCARTVVRPSPGVAHLRALCVLHVRTCRWSGHCISIEEPKVAESATHSIQRAKSMHCQHAQPLAGAHTSASSGRTDSARRPRIEPKIVCNQQVCKSHARQACAKRELPGVSGAATRDHGTLSALRRSLRWKVLG
jgi:hypothetical protein